MSENQHSFSDTVKNFIIVVAIIGGAFMLYKMFEFVNSAVGNILKDIFDIPSTIFNGLSKGFEAISGAGSGCFTGKDSDNNSVSTGDRVGDCFGIIGIILGGVLILGVGARYAYNKYIKSGTEQMKTMDDKLRDNIEKVMNKNSDTYKTAISKAKTALEKGGKYENDEQLQTDAEKLVQASVKNKASQIRAKQAKDIFDKSKNSADEQIVEKAQQKEIARANERSDIAAEIADRSGVTEQDVNDVADEIEDDVDKPLIEDL